MAEALVSARSSLRHNRVPHLLMASPLPADVEPEPGLSIEPFEPSGDPFVDKIANMRRSPFERTIFLDSDTYVVAEIVHALSLLDRYELACSQAPSHPRLDDPEVPVAFYELGSGVIAWRADDRVAAFLADWEQTCTSWREDAPFSGAGSHDQPALRRCAWQHGLAVMILGPEYNYRTSVPPTVVNGVKVIHGRDVDFEALAATLNASDHARSSGPHAETAQASVPSTRTVPTARGGSQPDARFRLTFVLPHQRRTTGGIYTMEQYARLLRGTMEVHLAVQDTTPTPSRGTTAGWALDAADLPDADVLVMPAETPDAWLLAAPAGKGRPVLYLQGFTTPGSPTTPANLKRFGDSATATAGDLDPGPNVIAVSRWLAAAAAEVGCRVAYVPLGLDRAIYSPGEPTSDRPPIVAMMTHEAEWKGADDGLVALAHVRATHPDVELVLFGTGTVNVPCEFHDAPSRKAVAALLRRACVFVVPSWEEGFGMTGVEALACGAALASTDTKGSRDYATDGETALVSPPRDPLALANNVLRLLEDSDLRRKLLEGAASLIAERVPSWEKSAEQFARAVADGRRQPRE